MDNEDRVSNNTSGRNRLAKETLSSMQVGLQEGFEEAIKELIKLGGSTIEGYKLAIKHMDKDKNKELVKLFLKQHEHHMSELRKLANNRKLSFIDSPDNFERILAAKMQVLIGELIVTEGDKPILQLLLNMEKDTNVAYERITRHHQMWQEDGKIFEEGLSDERNHQLKIVELLAC